MIHGRRDKMGYKIYHSHADLIKNHRNSLFPGHFIKRKLMPQIYPLLFIKPIDKRKQSCISHNRKRSKFIQQRNKHTGNPHACTGSIPGATHIAYQMPKPVVGTLRQLYEDRSRRRQMSKSADCLRDFPVSVLFIFFLRWKIWKPNFTKSVDWFWLILQMLRVRFDDYFPLNSLENDELQNMLETILDNDLWMYVSILSI